MIDDRLNTRWERLTQWPVLLVLVAVFGVTLSFYSYSEIREVDTHPADLLMEQGAERLQTTSASWGDKACPWCIGGRVGIYTPDAGVCARASAQVEGG